MFDLFNKKKADKKVDLDKFMSEEQKTLVNNLISKIERNSSNMGDLFDEWEQITEAYAGDQPIVTNRPNSRVNIFQANVEGQVSALVDQNIAVVCKGRGKSDQAFAKWAQVGLEWTLTKNKIKRILARHERRRELYGPAWLKIHFDPDAINGFGLVKIETPPINRVFVDGKVTDWTKIREDAEYIAELIGMKSKTWAIKKYGDVAYCIKYGGSDKASIWSKELTEDDEDGFWLLQCWTFTDGKLRKLEFSDDGVLLYDSFKELGEKPYNRKNEYPYWLTIMYEVEGELYGFGDGKLLRPLQDMINDLYDQIRRAARPNRVFFDPQSEVDLEDLDEDDGPVPCNDPNATIRVVDIGQVNNALWQLLANIHTEVQRVTRFSELMLGQSSKGKTATEAAIQQQQGSNATDFKKLMLQETMSEVLEYMLDLMMENYTEAKMFRIDENKDDYEWIDFRQMDNVPFEIPATSGYIKTFQEMNPDADVPKFQQLMDDEGNPVTKSVEFDIEFTIGAGMPKNKVFLYQMIQALAAMVVEGKNVIGWQEFRDFAKDFLGLPLDDKTLEQLMPPQGMPMQGAMGANGGTPPIPTGTPGNMASADVPGMSASGAPSMEQNGIGARGLL